MNQFYSFFFTHLQQAVSTRTIQSWLEPEQSTSFLAPETAEQNSLNILVSAYQPPGQIDITSDRAVFVLDVSSTIPIDGSWLTADLTTQPIRNFNTNLRTPLLSPAARRRFLYAVPGVTFDQVYPVSYVATIAEGVYPSQEVRTELYTENIIFVEPVAYRSVSLPEDATVYQSLTADNTKITNDLSHIPRDINESTLTADRTGSERLAEPGDVELDLQPSDLGAQRLVVTGMPEGNILVTWTLDHDFPTSQIVYPAFARGYTPASTIGLDMSSATLKEIALALMTLIELDSEGLVLSVLTELTFIWATVLENLVNGELNSEALPGLPTVIYRQYPQVHPLAHSRDTLQQAWIGLALVKAVEYLRSRPDTGLRSLPDKFDQMLYQLAQVVGSCLDGGIGISYVGYDDYGYLIEEPSFSATVVAQSFLQSYLSVNYDWGLHRAAAKLQQYLLSVTEVGSEDAPLSDPALLYRLFWNCLQNRHGDTDALVEQLNEQHEAHPFADFELGLWRYLLDYLPDEYLVVDYESLETEFQLITHDLYERKNSTQLFVPSLVCSSWQGLQTTQQRRLLQPFSFDLFAVEALGFRTFLYNEAKRMMPFGYRWMSEESLINGRFGAMLHSFSELGYSWALLYVLARQGLTLTQAQGWALDLWGRMLGVQRPTLQPDDYFRQVLLSLLTLAQSRGTIVAIEQLRETYGVHLQIVEPTPLTIQLAPESSEILWEDLSIESIDQITDESLATVERDWYPVSEILVSSTRQGTWAECFPGLVMYTDEVSVPFTRHAVQSQPCSIPLRVYARLSQVSSIPTRALIP